MEKEGVHTYGRDRGMLVKILLLQVALLLVLLLWKKAKGWKMGYGSFKKAYNEAQGEGEVLRTTTLLETHKK